MSPAVIKLFVTYFPLKKSKTVTKRKRERERDKGLVVENKKTTNGSSKWIKVELLETWNKCKAMTERDGM